MAGGQSPRLGLQLLAPALDLPEQLEVALAGLVELTLPGQPLGPLLAAPPVAEIMHFL